MMTISLFDLDENHLAQTAALWEDGWHDAHSKIVPEELAKLRTPESFLKRLRANKKYARIGLDDGNVLGLCITKENELYQMYVAPAARGRGVAQALLADSERRLVDAGFTSTWLACAVGNARAAKFYDKCGWTNVGIHVVELDTSDGAFPLEIWRFEKKLPQ